MIRALLAAVVLSGSTAFGFDEKPRETRLRMNPFHVNIGTVVSVGKDGTLAVGGLGNPRFSLEAKAGARSDLAEGWYVGFIGREFTLSTADLRLVRLQVTEIKRAGAATVKVSAKAAAKIKAGEDILLFRPPGSTTAGIKALPEIAPVGGGKDTALLGKGTLSSARALAQSKNNLKQIALAMHNYHDTHGRFPPAIVYGPDGKPWHSWRVLLLPFLDEKDLYDSYHFDEPWNGPRNSRLLSKMPAIYHDPVHGKKGTTTHYAAILGGDKPGKRTVFPKAGGKMKGKEFDFGEIHKGSCRIRDITDGTSNTVCFGSVSPDAGIRWMKPDDVTFDDGFPGIGEEDGFAAPFKTRGGAVGLFAFCDGSVRTLPAGLDEATVKALMTRDGGEVIRDALLDGPRARLKRGTKATQEIIIRWTRSGPKAELVGGEVDPVGRRVRETRPRVLEAVPEERLDKAEPKPLPEPKDDN